MKHLIPLTLFALALTPWHSARAQNGEVTLIAPGGIREAMEQMIPGFEKKTGFKVKPIFGTGLVTKKQVASGDDFDVAVVQPPYPAVIASGNALDATATPLASSAVGVAVRHGAPKPDISTPDAVKQMLLAAKSVAYPSAAIGAAAGVSFDETLKRLGIFDQVQAKVKPSAGGKAAMAMAAKGEVEIGVRCRVRFRRPLRSWDSSLPTRKTPRRLRSCWITFRRRRRWRSTKRIGWTLAARASV
jgi:molybdate transport system substrate-binding protein